MKVFRLVYASKTAKTVWYYTGQGMTATDGGWSQYDDDARTVTNRQELLQVMRLGGPRVTGNSLEDHYFVEERDNDYARDWTRHTQPAGEEYKDSQQSQGSGQMDLFALQPDQVGDGWVNDRPVPAVKATSTVEDAIKPSSSTSVSAEGKADQVIEASEPGDSDDLLKPLDFTDAISATDSKPESTPVIPFDDLLSVESSTPTSTSVPVRDQPEADSNATVSDESEDDDATPAMDVEDVYNPFEDLLAQEPITATVKAEPEVKSTRGDLLDLPEASTSVPDREQSGDVELPASGSATVSDDSVEGTLTDDDDVAGAGSDGGSADLSDTQAQVQSQVDAFINKWSRDSSMSDELKDYDAISATAADLRDFDGLLPQEPIMATTKAEPEAKPTLDDLPDLPESPTSVTDRESDDDEAWFESMVVKTTHDDLVGETLTSVASDDSSVAELDLTFEDLVDDPVDVQAESSAADDASASADHESNSGETDDADPWADFDMDEAVAPAPADEGSHDFTDLLDNEVVPANEVRPAMLLDEVTAATFDEIDQMVVDQEWLGYLIRQGAMLDLWTPAAVEQLLAILQTDDEADTTEDLKAWLAARPDAKPDNLTAWLQWGASLTTALEGQDELSVYHHEMGSIAQMVGRALGVSSKHSRWSDRVWTPLDRWLDRNHQHNLARLQELRVQWRELVMTLPISQVAKDRLLGPETLNPLTIDDVKWQSVGDALAFLRQPVAAAVWLSWRSIMEDMDVEDWRQADARYIYPAVMQWLQTVEPAVLNLQPHDPAWEVGVNYVATFGFELVDRVARWLQAQNQTDQVLNLVKYWTKPERIDFSDFDFRAAWLNDLSRETSELRTSRSLNLWLVEQSPVPILGRTVASLQPVVTVLHRYGQEVGHWPKDWWQAWSQEWLQAGLIDQALALEVAQWGETDRFALTADLPWAQASDDLDKHFYTSGQYPADFKIATDVAKETPLSRVDLDLYDPRLVYQAIQYLQAALRQRKPAETILNQLDGKIAQDMFHSLEMMNLSQLSDEQNREFLNLLQTTRRTRRRVKDLVLLLKALDAVFSADKLPKILHQLDNTASANRYHFRSQDFADALKQIAERGKEA